MRTIISSRIYIYNSTREVYEWCKENLIITNPMYNQLMRLGKTETISRKHIPEKMNLYVENGTNLILPFGVLNAIWTYIRDYPYELKFNDNGNVIDKYMKPTMPLYDYQEEAVERMIAARGGILEGACGCGKTGMGIEIIKRIGKNALRLCHTGDLLRQTVDRIHALYPSIEVGTITEGKINLVNNGITVSTIQTLCKIDTDIYKDKFDVIVTDESHHLVGSPTLQKMHTKIINAIPARYKYGLSATPTRSDTLIKSMYAYIGCNLNGDFEPVFKISKDKTNTLIAKHNRINLNTEFDYDTLAEDGTFNYMALVDFLSTNEKRNKTIVEHVLEASKIHKKQIVLCLRIDQCEIINKMINDKGLKSVLLVGKVTNKKRKEILESSVDWDVIVATISLAKEGLDVPELSCLHWAMVIGDKVATIQSAGRVERVFKGKPDPEIYDYVDINYPYCIGKYKKRVSYLKKR